VPSERETRKLLIDPRLQADGWRVVSYKRWLAGDRTAADRIIVVRQGRIIEQGDHSRLMARGGHYAELYDTYFRHQSLEYIERIRQMALEG